MLEETGTKVSISKVKRVLYRHNLEGCSARKKPLFQNCHKKDRLRFATAHGDKDCTFWRNVLWSDETKIKLFCHNDHRYVWRKKGDACKPKNTIPTVKHRGWQHHVMGVLCCRRDWCTSQNRWYYDYVDVLKQHLKTSVRKLKLDRK